ncbi:Brain-specific angiogenesis inhibitor 1-associated protein 2-like protein 2 [Takifugu flavidus]|uniref:Brain-specific angiogenesis inhibitor 1-associated protein 2-like protein 2 n=1 Tax=Takifugu flavidus TaxID=433684 RepID=A0A5C6NQP9_9TELE|nr:Brain-specific angiogenesis inhibitor 1-associated protein 2-like protein 2 [Takifugu flavidus]
MSAFHGDQLHRSTLRVYSNLVEDFNPSLQKLVSLGNSYIQAFRVGKVGLFRFFLSVLGCKDEAQNRFCRHVFTDYDGEAIKYQASYSERP